jgi:hypothetical protein
MALLPQAASGQPDPGESTMGCESFNPSKLAEQWPQESCDI